MVHGAEQVAADAKQIQDAVRRGVTAELVRDQTARGAALALQQRPEESCGSVPMGSGRPGSLLTLAPHIERHEIVCPRIDAFYTEHLYCGEDDLFGSGHPPDTVVAMALAYHAFKAGRQPGDYGVTI